MSRVVLFGDSFIARAGKFCGEDLDFGPECQTLWLGKGGMRADAVPTELLERGLAFRPNYVFLHLGGDDIAFSTNASDVAGCIIKLVTQFEAVGARVVVGGLTTRRRFRDPRLTEEYFKRVTFAINRRLRGCLGAKHVDFLKGLTFPRCWCHDGVHLSDAAMKRYLVLIRVALARLRF